VGTAGWTIRRWFALHQRAATNARGRQGPRGLTSAAFMIHPGPRAQPERPGPQALGLTLSPDNSRARS